VDNEDDSFLADIKVVQGTMEEGTKKSSKRISNSERGRTQEQNDSSIDFGQAEMQDGKLSENLGQNVQEKLKSLELELEHEREKNKNLTSDIKTKSQTQVDQDVEMEIAHIKGTLVQFVKGCPLTK